MKKNMGVIDRLLRATIALAVVILYLAGQITGAAAAVLGILAAIFLVTSITGFCPVLKVLGITTMTDEECRKADPGSHTCAH